MQSDKPTDNAVQQLFRTVRERYIARADGAFDFDAGLADVYARARTGIGSSDTASSVEYLADAEMAAIRTQIDRLTSVLRLVEQDDSTLAAEHLRHAMELLFELRALVCGSKTCADQLFAMLDRIGDHIAMADRELRITAQGSLAAAVEEALHDLGNVAIDPIAEFEDLCDLMFTILQGESSNTGHQRVADELRRRKGRRATE